MNTPNINNIKQHFLNLQNKLCQQFENIDGKEKFKENHWTKQQKKEGRSRIIKNGLIFEQATINFSYINDEHLPSSATEKRLSLVGSKYQAMGVSLVSHPINPYIPTAHLNVRFFITKNNKTPTWWFGGGFDLTPYYGFEEDIVHWHKTAQSLCEPYGKKIYENYKNWCDQYFFIKHRNEPRGVGGLFFDDLNKPNFDTCFNFIQDVSNGFLDAYLPIIKKRKKIIWGNRERQFQLYRRGRYIEFNLIYDRGTIFGLQSHGNTESILMSLPPLARWEYNYHPTLHSEEEKLYNFFLTKKNGYNV
ncbi:MAG: oxygen-dependent coproporphyrinogen oxidase [Arsenophonus sp.]|nr:MAG: oxygen-dependent coproporphyrinogen oxidase [Arsenophonus sp.]